MLFPELPVGSSEREALFAELRKTFVEDWKEAELAVERERRETLGDLYFVSAGSAIKIGRSTNFCGRLRHIQTHNHEKCELLLLVKGMGWREKELHRKFHSHRIHGDWFGRCPEILAEIERLRDAD
jgi:hypothetical protein